MNLRALTRIGCPVPPTIAACGGIKSRTTQMVEDVVTIVGAAASTAAVGALVSMTSPAGAGAWHAMGVVCFGVAAASGGAMAGGLVGEGINKVLTRFKPGNHAPSHQIITPWGSATVGAVTAFGAAIVGGFSGVNPTTVAFVGAGLVAGLGVATMLVDATQQPRRQ